MRLIERKDCPMRHENGNCTVAGEFCTAVNDPICEALHNAYDCGRRSIDPESLRPKGEWISVEDRLPQEGGAVCENVILFMDNGLVTVGWLNQITNRGYYLDTINDVVIKAPLSRFTHWMPLPEPPNCGADMRGGHP